MVNFVIELVEEPVYRCPICKTLSPDKDKIQACLDACESALEKVTLREGQIVRTTRTDDFDEYKVKSVVVEQSGSTRYVRVVCENISKGKKDLLPLHVIAQ